MRNTILYIIIGISICTCLVLSTAISCSPVKQSGDKSDHVSKEQISVESMAQNLMRSFVDTITKKKNYPEYYAGSYLSQKGDLVILVAGDTTFVRQDLLERCQGEKFIIQEAKNNRNSLIEIIDKIATKLYDRENGKYDIDSMNVAFLFLMEKENKIMIVLNDTAAQNIKRFREQIFDSPLLEFAKGSFRLD